MAINIDVPAFYRRLTRVFADWSANEEKRWKDVDGVCVIVGKDSGEIYQRYQSIQLWLFGWEVPQTLIVLVRPKDNSNGEFHFALTPKLASKLDSLKDVSGLTEAERAAAPKVVFHERTLKADQETYEACLDVLRGAAADENAMKLGLVAKEKVLGPFAENWLKAVQAAGVDELDVSLGWARTLMLHDDLELKHLKTSAVISVQVIQRHFVTPMEQKINDDEVITHEKLALQVDRVWEKPNLISPKLSADNVDASFPTIVTSGGDYDITPGKGPDKRRLHFGSIICALGARYRNYCSTVARTYMINPTKHQETLYKLILEAQSSMIDKLGEKGVKMSDVYNAGLGVVEAAAPELVKFLPDEFGHGLGIEFKERAFAFTKANDRQVVPGMVFNVSIGLLNVPLEQKEGETDRRAAEFGVYLSDTVSVGSSSVEVWTDKAKKTFKDVRYYLEDEEEEEEVKPEPVERSNVSAGKADASSDEEMEPEKKPKKSASVAPGIRERNLRQSTKEAAARASSATDGYDADAVEAHQKDLQLDIRRRLEKQFDSSAKEEKEEKIKKLPMSYRSHAEYPSMNRLDQIYVDTQRESVLFPLYGSLVPFHIATIKNVQQDAEFLRVNFLSPMNTARATGGEMAQAMLKHAQRDDPHNVFVKEALFRVPDAKQLENHVRKIKQLRKTFTDREKESAEQADLVQQEPLVLRRTGASIRLQDVFIRPYIVGTRKTLGHLEAHVNGFRFSPIKSDQSVDILYKNVLHAFVQKAENDYLTILHLHLRNPIMLGKKKAQDVQFCVEVVEMSQALDARSARYGRDDLAQEQHERQQKRKLNDSFVRYAAKVREFTANGKYPIEFDVTYKALSFQGVPSRSRVLITPSVHCLVSLSEAPFFVLPLNDIEIVSLERVQFGLQSFDMVFVLKDYSKNPVTINTVDMSELENIKKWLDQCDLKFYQGPTNLLWNQIMTEVRKDPLAFHEEQNFWGFLEQDQDGEDEAVGEDGEEEDYDFPSVSSDDDYDGESSEEDFSESATHSSDYSEADDSSGEDWDELEEKAEKEDKKTASKRRDRGDNYDSDEDRPSRPQKRARR